MNKSGSSGNKADSEGIKIYDKDMKEMLSMMNIFNPCMYEPEKEITSTSLSSTSDYSNSSSKESNGLENP